MSWGKEKSKLDAYSSDSKLLPKRFKGGVTYKGGITELPHWPLHTCFSGYIFITRRVSYALKVRNKHVTSFMSTYLRDSLEVTCYTFE